MLLRPRQVFRSMIAQGNHDIAFFSMLLGGIMLLLVWADLFDLGRFYAVGRIMSGALILGPMVGILFFLLTSTAGLWLGKWLGQSRKLDFNMTFACLSKASWVYVPLAILLVFTSFGLDATGFGGTEPGSGGDGFWLALKMLFLMAFLYMWLQLLREGFEMGWGRSLVAGLVSTGLAIGVVLVLVSFGTGIQLM